MKYIKPRNLLKDSESEFKIPNSIWELNKIFNDNGYKLYVVGGAVRDFITGDKPKDFDLCTDAIPSKVISMLKSKYRVQLQGEAFGVVVVFTEDDPEGMEIATFREDISKGRNPEVRIGGVTIEQDVNRRDLSINSLFFDLETKEIVDLVGGQEDLKNKIIRMNGDPMVRIEEDSLRILRTFRFATRYGSTLDEKTSDAIHRFNDISSVSMERIWDSRNGEFIKSFKQAKDFQQYLDLLTDFGIMEQILPGLKVNSKITNQDSLVLVLSQMLSDNNSENDLKKVLNKCSLPTILVSQIIFLKSLLSFDSNSVLQTYKSKVRFLVDNDTIDKWLEIKNVQDKDILKFTKFYPTITAKSVMDEFNLDPKKDGPIIGKKINELEVELFNNM